MHHTWSSRLLAGFAAMGLLLSPAAAREAKLVVFAAASLKNALDEVNASWTTSTGKAATVSYAASSALAKQIEEGAPADVFVSADLDWMDHLEQRNLLRVGSRSSLLGNRLVLVAPQGSPVDVKLELGTDLAAALDGGKLAMANTESVPAGKYGKEALQTLGMWEGVSGSVAQAENVRAALLLVSRGEAPLGVVYRTDAAADPAVRVVGTFAEDTHPPIVYPAAALAKSSSPDGTAYLDFLKSADGARIFEKHGFSVLD